MMTHEDHATAMLLEVSQGEVTYVPTPRRRSVRPPRPTFDYQAWRAGHLQRERADRALDVLTGLLIVALGVSLWWMVGR